MIVKNAEHRAAAAIDSQPHILLGLGEILLAVKVHVAELLVRAGLIRVSRDRLLQGRDSAVGVLRTVVLGNGFVYEVVVFVRAGARGIVIRGPALVLGRKA